MKTILFFMSFSFALVSCSKKYDCECKCAGVVCQTYQLNDTKKSAKQTCDTYSKGLQSSSPNADVECLLK